MDLGKWDTRCGIGLLDNPQVFRGLMGDQRIPGFWGVTLSIKFPLKYFLSIVPLSKDQTCGSKLASTLKILDLWF